MNTFNWYSELIKPSWAPPSWLFGKVWAVLYTIIFISFGIVFYKAITREISFIVVLPFILNLVFNFAFSPIQFGLRNNVLAVVDIVLVVITLVWAFIALWNATPELRWVVYINVPYLLWGTFATFLQLTLTYLNR